MKKKDLIAVLKNVSLPDDFHWDERRALVERLEGASGTELEAVEREVFAQVSSWGRADLTFYDQQIYDIQRIYANAPKEIAKYEALKSFIEVAQKRFQTYSKQAREARAAGKAVAADTQERADIVAGNKLATAQQNRDDESDYVESVKTAFYTKNQDFVDSFLANSPEFRGIFGKHNKKKFENLPAPERAKRIEAYIEGFRPEEGATEVPEIPGTGIKYVAFDAAAARRAYASMHNLATGTFTEVADALEGRDAALKEEIESLNGVIKSYNDFVQNTFQSRTAAIAAITANYTPAKVQSFMQRLQEKDPTATLAIDRASRKVMAQEHLAALQADIETEEAKGATADITLIAQLRLEEATLSGYIERVDEQAKVAPKIEGKLTDNIELRDIVAFDMAADRFDYVDEAFAHYVRYQLAHRVPQEQIARDAKKIFGSYVPGIAGRVAYEDNKRNKAVVNFTKFVQEVLEPTADGYKPGDLPEAETAVEKLLAENSKKLTDRRETLLTSTQPTLDHGAVKELDAVAEGVGRDIVHKYTTLTMARESLLAKDNLTLDEKRQLQVISQQLQEVVGQATENGLLYDLIEADKVAIETLVPDFDKIKQFAESQGIDMNTPEGRAQLATMQDAYRDFVTPQPGQDPTVIESVKAFIQSDPQLAASFNIEFNEKTGKYVLQTLQNGQVTLEQPVDKLPDGFLQAFGFDQNGQFQNPPAPEVADLAAATKLMERFMPNDPAHPLPAGYVIYGQAGAFTSLSEYQADMSDSFNAIYNAKGAGKDIKLFEKLCAHYKTYYEQIGYQTRVEAQEAAADVEETVVTKRESMEAAVENTTVKTGKATGNKATAKTFNKKLKAIADALEVFDEGQQNDVTQEVKAQAVATAAANMLGYLSKYNAQEIIGEMRTEREQAIAADPTVALQPTMYVDIIEIHDPNDPTKVVGTQPAVIRTLEDGSTETYTAGADGKLNMEVKEPTQVQ